MMTKRKNQQIEMHLIAIEDFVPMDHLLRKVNDIIDFSFIYSGAENLYCRNKGRPSIDPVLPTKSPPSPVSFMASILKEEYLKKFR